MLYTTLLTPFQVDSFDRALSKQLSIHFNHHENLWPVLLLSLATGLVQASPVTEFVVTDGMPSFPYKRLITMLTSLSRHSQLCLDPRAFGGILLWTGPEGLHLFWLHGCWMQISSTWTWKGLPRTRNPMRSSWSRPCLLPVPCLWKDAPTPFPQQMWRALWVLVVCWRVCIHPNTSYFPGHTNQLCRHRC